MNLRIGKERESSIFFFARPDPSFVSTLAKKELPSPLQLPWPKRVRRCKIFCQQNKWKNYLYLSIDEVEKSIACTDHVDEFGLLMDCWRQWSVSATRRVPISRVFVRTFRANLSQNVIFCCQLCAEHDRALVSRLFFPPLRRCPHGASSELGSLV